MSHETHPAEIPPQQTRALACLLDTLVPPSPERGLPGAGEIGLGARILQKAPELQPLLAAGLSALDDLARGRGAPDFAALSPSDRADLLNEVVSAQPAFLPGVLFHTYTGYYQHPRVLAGLGLEPRPPHPQGYELGPSDPALLDAVRARPRLYRRVEDAGAG